eukprot:5679911-Amphidinium_carterae.1
MMLLGKLRWVPALAVLEDMSSWKVVPDSLCYRSCTHADHCERLKARRTSFSMTVDAASTHSTGN